MGSIKNTRLLRVSHAYPPTVGKSAIIVRRNAFEKLYIVPISTGDAFKAGQIPKIGAL